MAKKSRSHVALFDAHDRYIKFIPHDEAALRLRNGQYDEKKREHGRLLEVRLKRIYNAKPSNSRNTPTLITAGECRMNAFAHMKQRLGERLNEAEQVVLEKIAGFDPAHESYLGPSWSDRLVAQHA